MYEPRTNQAHSIYSCQACNNKSGEGSIATDRPRTIDSRCSAHGIWSRSHWVRAELAVSLRRQFALESPCRMDFHRPQSEALASAGVDFLHLATAPSVEEALGVADAMADTGLSYMISFVIRRSGVLLDGTPLGHAIVIDAKAARPLPGRARRRQRSRSPPVGSAKSFASRFTTRAGTAA